ncbi:MAG: TIGR00159 family protein, partial [Erysipelotrichaceae bacterium]
IVKNNSRTIQIFKGVLLIIIIRFAASVLELNTVKNLADSIMNWGVIAIIIIFQPEIRNILEKIGKTSVFSRISTLTVNEREQLVDELVKSCAEMSKTKT